MCGGHTSAGVLSRPFGDSIARLGRDWQEGGGGSLPGSRGSAFFVLYRGCVGMPVFRTENLAQPRGLITAVSRPPWGRSLLRPIGLHAGMRGTTPRADCACEAPRTPSFFFVREKERWGRKKKPSPTDAQEKDTSHKRNPIQPRSALTPKGAIVRIYAYQLGSVSFSRATSALTRVSVLERSL